MSEQELLAGLQAVAREHLAFVTPLTRDQVLAEALAQDSLARLTLVVEVENHFQICLEDDEAMGLVTVGDVLDVVAQKLRATGR